MSNPLRLTKTEMDLLDTIKAKARVRHEKERRAARQRGRLEYPLLPWECSWAYEEEFRRRVREDRSERKKHNTKVLAGDW